MRGGDDSKPCTLGVTGALHLLSLFPQWAQDLNTALGMLGFFITVAVMIQVGSIRRSFLSRARLPELVQELQKSRSALSAHLEAWPRYKNDALSQVKIAATLIAAAIPLVPNGSRKPLKIAVKKLAVAVKQFDSTDPREGVNRAWDLYSDIQISIVHLNQAIRNLKWE